MNRREAIAAALASIALPRAVIAKATGPSYSSFDVARKRKTVYIAEQGDRGRVWLDGREVKAVACYPGDAARQRDDRDGNGWVECLIDKGGKPLGMDDPPVIVADRVFKRRFFGRIRFQTTA